MIEDGKLALGDKVLVSGITVKVDRDFVVVELKTGNKKTQKVKVYNSDSGIIMPL